MAAKAIRFLFGLSMLGILFPGLSARAADMTYFDARTGSIVDVLQAVPGSSSVQVQDIFNEEYGTRDRSELIPQVGGVGGLNSNSNVLFYDVRTGRFAAGQPSMFFENGKVVFPEWVYTENAQDKVYQIVDQSVLIREVPSSPDGIKKGDTLCLKERPSTKVTIRNVYKNGMVQARVGLFHYLDVLDLKSDLVACTPDSSVTLRNEKAPVLGAYAPGFNPATVFSAQ